ncbi:MAG: hypothetical protein F6K58_02760 [Symploca sp. SIO2E9]|nr:hypothetical protein [Symploca sp. SIO2E9]
MVHGSWFMVRATPMLRKHGSWLMAITINNQHVLVWDSRDVNKKQD